MKVQNLTSLIATSLLVKAYSDSAAAKAQKIEDLKESAVFVETFEHKTFDETQWVKSTHEKYASQNVLLDNYSVAADDKGLILTTASNHYGLSATFDKELSIDGTSGKEELVVQYEVNLKNGLTCGGAYVKLLPKDPSINFKDLNADTRYVIMFGPDKCGPTDKVHFIIQLKNPVTGAYETKHLRNPPLIKNDKNTHLYTLVVKDDNTFEILIDQQSELKGSLFDSFDPPVVPPKEIEDPEDVKPDDWVDDAFIADPNAQKPDDWDEDAPMRIVDEDAVKPEDWLEDEPQTIADPSVQKPDDWDDEDDGEWIAPQIPNPKCETVSGCGPWTRPTKANPDYKGKWKAPMIENPDYVGEWKRRQIPNPDYYDLTNPARMDPIGAIAIEIWTTNEGITFDNFWVGHNKDKALEFSKITWEPKHKEELSRTPEASKTDEGVNVKLFEHFLFLSTLAQQHPYIALSTGFTAFILLSAMLYLCFSSLCSKKRSKAPSKKEDNASDTKKESSDAAEALSNENQKLRQRKKAPQTQDD